MDPFTHNRDLRNLMLRETFVRTVESYEEIDSTNTRALAIVGDVSVEHPCMIIADRQTAGRGRQSLVVIRGFANVFAVVVP